MIREKIYKYLLPELAFEKFEDSSITYIDEYSFSQNTKLLKHAAKHPILTPAVDFVGQMFSRAEFWVEKDGVKLPSHWLTDLLMNPGFSLTRSDFLRGVFNDSVFGGTALIMPITPAGFKKPSKLRLLNPFKITYPIISKADYYSGNYDKYRIIEDKQGSPKKHQVRDIVFIRDLAVTQAEVVSGDNGYNSRMIFTSGSRFDGMLQVLYNTVLSLEAKEVILKTNGKEMYTSKSSDNAMSNAEKTENEEKINQDFGMTGNRSRAMIFKTATDWKSLHIAMRDLGLDESLKTDSALILGALHIPRDIKGLDSKKSSYNNQKESIVAYYQNILQTKVDDFAESLTKSQLSNGHVLKGGYEHLPVMKYILDQKYKGIKELGSALKGLLEAGIEWEDALELCGLDSGYKFKDNGKGKTE